MINMSNRLATHLTTWKWWYALPALPALILASLLTVLAGQSESSKAFTVPMQFIAFAALALLFLSLLARRWPTVEDLGLRPTLSRRDLAVVAAVFVVTHLTFYVLGKFDNSSSTAGTAKKLFTDMSLDGPLPQAMLMMFTSAVLAGVCEEILYRGAMLRPIHDHLARRGMVRLAALVSIAVTTIAFAMPHLGDAASGQVVFAYLLSGFGMGLVYVLTGSLTATMVAHSLQSCFAFAQLLYLSRADHDVSPALWILVLAAPVLVFLFARLLYAVFPKGAGGGTGNHPPEAPGSSRASSVLPRTP